MIKTLKVLSVLLLIALAVLGWFWFSADNWQEELSTPAQAESGIPDIGWPGWGNDSGGSRFSNAKQITPDRIKDLKPVWEFHTGEDGEGRRSGHKLSFQATPILIGSTLYFSTAFNHVFAVDAESGKAIWEFDAEIDPEKSFSEVSNRGVTYWEDTTAAEGAVCSKRIFVGTLDARLLALDASTGKPCADFSDNGQTSLFAAIAPLDRGVAYPVTSPPVIIGDTVVLGSGMIDNWKAHLGLGTVWAYDTRSGDLRWKWHAIPRNPDADYAADWIPEQAARTGTANVWSPMSVDADLGLVFAATGSASPDYYGGGRLGSNRLANSLVALDIDTGKVVWSQQLVHHDLWDYDLASQPVLADIKRDGKSIPVVIQATKMGLVFSFHRQTGEPFFDVEERPVPISDIPGEQSWPTQPFPVAPPPLVPHQALTRDDAWGPTKSECADLIGRLRSEGIYTPPSLEGTIMLPGNAGGSNWGGVSWDPGRQILVANTMHLPFEVALIPRDEFDSLRDSGKHPGSEFSEQLGTPFGMRRKALISSLDLPCYKPPWGTLAAIDMVEGEILWQVPFGSTRDLTPLPFGLEIGTPNLGGSLLLESGIIFIGAAMDNYLRAFDIETGEEIWRDRLPAGGQATPMTYQLNGRQYVVIAAGGHGGLGTTRGDSLVAFAISN